MSERHKAHNGRTAHGDREKPVESLALDGRDPIGTAAAADSVLVDGAIADVGANATSRADRVQAMIDQNRDCVDKFRNPDPPPTRHP
ncbi:hypothetical protein [Roseisolibacter sp. H3M3-2]|uniref:hypothetical protein n=1 Tax=Roseisolibacter sp. H3M3-2 TaxID=3031323 RepID=UPI0023D9F23D|nr:hypothetical protein [Roseisolibacter sp. H3M3-2]MDF1502559.1 hypothetical protein [Roseisolibacter sp. H3M3-2]